MESALTFSSPFWLHYESRYVQRMFLSVPNGLFTNCRSVTTSVPRARAMANCQRNCWGINSRELPCFCQNTNFCDFFVSLRDGAEWQRQAEGRHPIIFLAFFCLELYYPVDLIVDEIMLLDGIFPIVILLCFAAVVFLFSFQFHSTFSQFLLSSAG